MTTWRLCSHSPSPPPPPSFSDPGSFPSHISVFFDWSSSKEPAHRISKFTHVFVCASPKCIVMILRSLQSTIGRICRFSYLVWNCSLLAFQLHIFSTYITEKKFFRLPWKPACMIVTTFLVVEVWLLPLSDFLITNKNFPCLSSVNPWKLNKNK